MRLHALSGRPERALAQYERLRDALQKDIGTRPTEATRRLRDEIAAGRLRMTPPAGPHPQEELAERGQAQPARTENQLRRTRAGDGRGQENARHDQAPHPHRGGRFGQDAALPWRSPAISLGTYPDGAQDARACPPVRPREAGAERGGGNHKACSCRIGFGNGGGCRIRLLRRREDRSAHDLCAGGTISRPGAPRPTRREREVAALIAQGMSNRQISYRALDLRAHGGQPRRKHSREARPPLAGPHRQLGKRIVASNRLARLRLRTPRLPRSEPLFSGWGRK